MSRPGKGLKSNLLIHDVKHAVATTIAGFPFFLALPSVLDVSRGAPKISYTVRPEPWPASAPFANAKDNRPARGVQRGAHDLIRRARILRRAAAPVILQIIHTPSRILPRVLKLISTAARTALASLCSGVGIQAEFQAFGMDIVGERLHARRKMFGIGHDVPVAVALHLPAVIDNNVLVAGILHAGGDHRIGTLPDQILTDVTAE